MSYESSGESVVQSGQFMPAVSRFIGTDTPTLESGRGARIFDENGNEYIDFFAMHGALSHGYSHPSIVEAVSEQAAKLNFSSYDFPTEPSRKLVDLLAEVTPGGLDSSYLVNSGSEAVEVALTLARKATGSHEFIALGEGFHGRTYGARSLVGWSGYRSGFGPFRSGTTLIPSHNMNSSASWEDDLDPNEMAEMLEYALQYQTGDVAAFIAEPMLGTAGNIPAPEGYFERIREICDDHGILLIIDEVITGFGRTGTKFGIQHYDVEPDIMTVAKSLGGGVPIGAAIAGKGVSKAFEPMDYFSTFGGNPLSAAAGVAAIETMRDEQYPDQARRKGKLMMSLLEESIGDSPAVENIRGKGLFIGVDLIDPSTGDPLPDGANLSLKRAALDRGLVLPAGQGWNGNTVRINPPLVISEDEIRHGVETFSEVLAATVVH